MNITRPLTEYYNDEITFNQLYPQLLPSFRAMAHNLHRRWRVAPNKLGVEDTIQNMFTYFLKAIRVWTPAHGMPIQKYISYSVRTDAERQIHKARGVPTLRDGSKHSSCGERNNSEFYGPDSEEGPLERASVPPGQESADKILDALARASDERDQLAIADLISSYYNGETSEGAFTPLGKTRGPSQTEAGIAYDVRLKALRRVVDRMKEPKYEIAI